jgi:hypothetical protein
MNFLNNNLQKTSSSAAIFLELVSSQELDALIPPAAIYVFAKLTEMYPNIIHIFNKADYIFSISISVIQWNYLRDWHASFSEHFYGLKRCNSQFGSLSTFQQSLSLIELVYSSESFHRNTGHFTFGCD